MNWNLRNVKALAADYGMIFVLLALCLFFSWATWDEQHPNGAAAAEQIVRNDGDRLKPNAALAIVARSTPEDVQFARRLEELAEAENFTVLAMTQGQPSDFRQAMEALEENGRRVDAILANQTTWSWGVVQNASGQFSVCAEAVLIKPESYHWPNFLKRDNLLNVANQIVVIAVIAIGMTLVIITGGIDLSVGSLIALSAVIAAWVIREWAGAESAGWTGMTAGALCGIAGCALLGLFSGCMVTVFRIPPFIATLGMMQVASGLAFIVAQGQSIYQIPSGFVWLGRGSGPFGLPNAVILMLALYGLAHLLMTRTLLGRYIYAVGGNAESARLSGVPVKRVTMAAYVASGALAGLGGVITASQLNSGSPTYGLMYELYVIAAVVVGGASLSGGEGKILGTLIGAFIIAVIQNGMNLTGVESYTQKVVLGAVILAAVLLDRLKRGNWRMKRFRRAQ